MSDREPRDYTPESAAPTDIAPLGRDAKPEHEKTASEDADPVNWDALAAAPEFKALLLSKAAFILPATIFFTVYYFALPILVGWFPELMKAKVGSVNVAYLFALSQFFMAWIVAGFYVIKAAGWDKSAAALLTRFKH